MSLDPSRPIGLAHLTLMQLSPPELVTVAAAAGYAFVGVRVTPATPGEQAWPMELGSPMSRETQTRLADTGLFVNDVEFLALSGTSGPAYWLPALEAGAALGATTIIVAGTDPDRARLTDALGQLVDDAKEFGIRPILEPISYHPVHRVNDAAALASVTGAALMIDALHVHRGGSHLDEVRALHPDLVACLQLCDGPEVAPESLDVPDVLPLGMTTNGSALQVEARVLRQLPGEGDFQLTDLVTAVPSTTAISVEVPSVVLQASMSPLAFAVGAFQAAQAVVRRASYAVG